MQSPMLVPRGTTLLEVPVLSTLRFSYVGSLMTTTHGPLKEIICGAFKNACRISGNWKTILIVPETSMGNPALCDV